MATPPVNQGFLGTPGFQLYRRGLIVQTIKRFRGLNNYIPLTQVTPDVAIDLLNVIVGSNGELSKLRLPINLSPAVGGIQTGPLSFWDFQQGTGTRQVLAHFGSSLYYFTNDLVNSTLIETNPLNTAAWSFVVANNILFGANGSRMQKWTGSQWQQWGITTPAVAPVYQTNLAGSLSPATGYSWRVAFKNSVTGHISSSSPISASTGALNNREFQLFAGASPDSQVDTIVWFRNLDGGGDYFRLAEVNLTTQTVTFNSATVTISGTGGLTIIDNTPDANLDLTTRAPLINNLPPQGKYVALAQGRIFIAGLANSSQVAYSGYEQIINGRPEESFPPGNLLQLALGAESVVGIGVIHNGPVFFSNTGKMFALRGAIEDITLAAPIAFSEFLEELPWTLGCLSHYTIQSTPYGLVWLAGDKTVQFWDGRSNPLDISQSVYPLLRTITPGTELQATGTYFNWLERDWYALTCATSGSTTPNTIIFWALDAQASNVEVFVSSLSASWLGVVSTSKLQRKLLLANAGRIAELPVRAVDANGLVNDFVTYPPTNGNLRAYWRGGYFGNESPEQSKLFRWTRIVPDRGTPAYQVQSRYVDDNFTIDAPRLVGPTPASQARVPLNQRGFRASVEIDFPQTDTSCNVLELQLAYIGTSQR